MERDLKVILNNLGEASKRFRLKYEDPLEVFYYSQKDEPAGMVDRIRKSRKCDKP